MLKKMNDEGRLGTIENTVGDQIFRKILISKKQRSCQ